MAFVSSGGTLCEPTLSVYLTQTGKKYFISAEEKLNISSYSFSDSNVNYNQFKSLNQNPDLGGLQNDCYNYLAGNIFLVPTIRRNNGQSQFGPIVKDEILDCINIYAECRYVVSSYAE